MALADDFDGLLIDLDGVVWIGREAVPGAVETLRTLLATRKRIVTAGVVAARLAGEAAGPGGGAFVIGGTPLKEMVAATGTELLEGEAARGAGVVVVSGHRGFDYGELLTAKLALDGGAAFVATSQDPTMPMPGGEWPGTGAVLAAVETASGRVAEIAGKPERHLFEMALAALGQADVARGSFVTEDDPKEPREPGSRRVAMVGDRISSDIEGGRRAGLATILVLSGASDDDQAEAAEPRPDHVIDDLAGLLR
jgi:HAD superfamily hydrolase (TIGR01450 family)